MTINKQKIIGLITHKLNDLEQTEDMGCYFVMFNDARELLGAIHAFWLLDLLTDKERDDYNELVYYKLSRAEKYVHLTKF